MDKLEIAGRVVLADRNDSTITANNGMGGQGVLPLPLAEKSRLQRTIELLGSGKLTPEVEGWLKQATKSQIGRI